MNDNNNSSITWIGLHVTAPKTLTLYYYYFLGPTSTKPQAEILKLNNVNGCNDISFYDHSILEGNRIIIIIIIIYCVLKN